MGEIIVHGSEVFQGDKKHPEATAVAFIEFEDKRFLRTGDMGRMDEDGYFFMAYRLRRMITTSAVLKFGLPKPNGRCFAIRPFRMTCVVAAKDAYRGESAQAVATPRSTHKDTIAQEMIDGCRIHMTAHKVLREIEFVDALPKSGSGKAMRRRPQEKKDV